MKESRGVNAYYSYNDRTQVCPAHGSAGGGCHFRMN
jgi:hypothetical protein